MSSELLKLRIQTLKSSKETGQCVVYVMSRDQRVRDNHALIAAQKHALAKKLPLAVIFCLYEKSGFRAREQYDFMLTGLMEIEQSLGSLDIPFMLLIGKPQEKILALCEHTIPDAIYFDSNPLRGPRQVVSTVVAGLEKSVLRDTTSVYVVDTHNVVPVWLLSDKQEVGAYTLRPKLHKLLAEFLQEPDRVLRHPHVWPGRVQTLDNLSEHIKEVLVSVPFNNTNFAWESGEAAALAHLKEFANKKLERYAVERNDPSSDSQSDLSPYLHFGQLSSLRVALYLRSILQTEGRDLHFLSSPKMPKPEDAETTLQHGVDSVIEEMLVRKELADNYCYYNENYDSLAAAPKWARDTLDKHRTDPRDFLYSVEQFENADTHDEAWNAAQRQLRKTGKMHGYMRMYWAKKVLEWTENPEQAIEYLKYLNDHYSIDGGDPNGYAGILWSIAGVHDRPWQERPVFGAIRYMNYAGLKRKFDIESYEQQWQ